MSDTNLSDSEPLVEIQLSESSQIVPDGGAAMMGKELQQASEATDGDRDDDEDEELRNAIEKDFLTLSLKQAQLGTTRERLQAVVLEEEGNDEGAGAGAGVVKKYHFDQGEEEEEEEEDGKGTEGVEANNEEVDVQVNYGDSTTNFGRYNPGTNRRRVNYPMRPDAEDCAFYMKFGSCKFGSNCKFNHPLRRKNEGVKEGANHKEDNSDGAGQTRCKYYMTSEGCKYGSDCRYYHGPDKLPSPHALELNFLRLPIRPGEKECPYYMRTGCCKYGSTCRFHHPEPSTAAGSGSSSHGNSRSLPSQLASSSSLSSWSSSRPFNETSQFVSVMFSLTQNAPTSNQKWNGHQAASYPTSEKTLPIPPAFAMSNQITEIHLPILGEYPERPGEPECSFFMKTGDCKFKSNCKFHHPKNRISWANANSFALNDKGLPLRPDHPICAHYQRYGICKYGPACKYDHPPQFSVGRPPFLQPPFGKSNIVYGAVEIGKVTDI